MIYETIRVEEKFGGQISEIRLNTPPANILSEKMIREISHRLDEELKTPQRKLIVFAGEGKHFSFGASVEEHLPERVNDMLPAFNQLALKMIEFPVPTLARVSGLCLGGAFELALCCSLVYADESAQFGVPEIQLGVFPPVAAAILPYGSASGLLTEMILTGEKLPARRLYDRGLINRVVEVGKLDSELLAFIEKQILPKSAASLKIACQATRVAMTEGFNKSIETLEKLYLNELMKTQDAVEGIRAFVQKRAPVWRNE
jgi:cyclohexa-1,5-dienecarbonyl-CoA hydratase